MKYFLTFLLLSSAAFSVTYISEPADDIVRGSHTYDSLSDKYSKNVASTGSSIVSTSNTTSTALGASATYTGTGEQNNQPQVGVMIKTDGAGVLFFDFSGDGVNWDSTFPVNGFVVSAGIPDFHTAVKLGRYFRVRFVNGTTVQTYMRLFTYYGSGFMTANSPYNQMIGIDSDSLSTRPSNFNDEVVLGKRSGVAHFTKFGYRENLTASGGEETIWAKSATFTPQSSADTYVVTYNSTTDGDATTGATSIFITYLDSNGLSATATHVLGDDGADTTAFSGLGINRIAVTVSGSEDKNTNEISVATTTGSSIQAVIPAGHSVTQTSIFNVDYNSDAVAALLYARVSKPSGGQDPRVQIIGYVYNRGTDTRYEVYRELIDASVHPLVNLAEPVGFKLSAQDVIYFVADTNQDNTVVSLRLSLREYKRD